ncbi:MAG: hypothetical protein ACLUHE_02065 [Christensenellales bacterium]
MAACARVLQNGGRLCAVFPAPRFLALCDAMRGAKVEPKRVRFIVSRPENAPKLVLVEGKKRGRPGLHLLPMLDHAYGGRRLHRRNAADLRRAS